jgi:3-phosphoshikimate 1-carboxyvinyltransferase
LAPLALLVDGLLVVEASPRLRERPFAPLLAALDSLGVSATPLGEPNHLPVALRRRAPLGASLARPAVQVDATTSSQFASALLLVAPTLPAGLDLTLGGAPVSRPYLELTVEVMRAFGARVTMSASAIAAEPGGYRPATFTVEGDWSSAALLLAAGYVARRRVEVDGVSAASTQGDRAFAALLAELDLPGRHELDLRDHPDLVAPLTAAAIVSERQVVLRGLTHARLKESDRPAVLACELGAVGARIALVGDALVIEPGSVLQPGELDPHGDHRMAMAFGALTLRQPGLRVRDPSCVDKSFPGYWAELERLR